MARRRSPIPSPLPFINGIAPSYLWLPQGEWPSLYEFLLARFSHLDPGVLAERLTRGDMVNDQGQALSLSSPYRAHMRIWYHRQVESERPVPGVEHIIYQDERILVVDKPHFLATIPAGRHLQETLLTRLRQKLHLFDIAPAHRLDRETAGLVLFCKQPALRGRYQALFQQQQVSKLYLAVAPIRQDLELPRYHRSRIEKSELFLTMVEQPGEANSQTYIELIRQEQDLGLYRLQPKSGRQHQLRLHLASLGIGIVNDPWYPDLLPERADNFDQPLQLLAKELAFIDPISQQPLHFCSPRQLCLAESATA